MKLTFGKANMEFARLVRILTAARLRHAGVTAREIARQAGVSRSTVYRWLATIPKG